MKKAARKELVTKDYSEQGKQSCLTVAQLHSVGESRNRPGLQVSV